MQELIELNAPWWTFIVRAAIVYFFVLLVIRMSGKRAVGEFTPFDLVVVILLAETMQSALVPEEKSVVASAIAGGTLVALNWLVGFASARSKQVDRLVEGEPVVLVRNGRIVRSALKSQNVPESDIHEAVRRHELKSLQDVKLATLETDGEITMVPRSKN